MSWRKVRLGDIGRVAMCKRVLKGHTAASGDIPFYKIGTFGGEANAFISSELYESLKSKYSYPQKGNVLISAAGTIGKVVLFDGCPSYFQDSNIVWLEHNGDYLSDRYLYYFLLKHEWQITQGATIQRLYNEDIRNTEINLPPLPVQRKIADILGTYDDLIENNRRRIALLERMSRELYREYFVREGGCLDEVGLMECSFISFCTSRIKKYDGIKRYLATADVDGRSIVGHGELLQYDELPSRAQMLPELYSVWFARMSASYKILAFSDSNADLIGELILSSGFAGFKSDKEHWPYVRSFFSSEWFNSEKDRFATGATQISITNDGLTRIKIPVPQEKDVVEYARLVNPIFCEVDLLKKQSANLARQRDRLLPRLMSGKIDLDKLVKGEVENG